MELMVWAYVAVFVFGSMIGSFLNVCIFRLPEGKSVVFPGSHCPQCKKPIRWFDNIPIASYFILKGRCRDCGAAISPQYALVETIGGGLAVLYAAVFGFTPTALVFLLFSDAFLAGSIIDLRYRIIPDQITLTGIVAGLVCSAVFPSIHHQPRWTLGLLQSVIGMLAGGGFLYLSATLVEKVIKKEAMGGGDVKLLAMIGSILGWQGALWSIFVSSITGSVVGIYYKLRRGEETLAFGPHIAMAAVIYMFAGRQVIAWYLNSLGLVS